MLFLPRARFVVVASSLNRRSKQESGLYKDVYFDDLLLDIDSYFKIEHIGSNKLFAEASELALIESNITSTLFKTLSALLARVHMPKSVSKAARGIFKCLQREGLEDITFKEIARVIGHFYWGKKLYHWLFSRIEPDYLLLIDAYDDHTVVAAAKERDIQVVELQHGFLDRHHIGYSWSKYALPFKAQMPIPDRVFLYGEYWKQELEVKGFWEEELRAVGSLRVDQWRQRKIERSKETCTLVVTTQNLDTERLIAYLSDFVDMVDDQDFRLFIKLHQGEANDRLYQEAFGADKRVHVLLASEPPSTFELLARSDFHLSIYSTCHYEALALGTPTVILPLTGYESVLPLHRAGHAFLAERPSDLVSLVLRYKTVKVPDAIGSFYFSLDALKNLKRELKL
jgi:hypothetical protein